MAILGGPASAQRPEIRYEVLNHSFLRHKVRAPDNTVLSETVSDLAGTWTLRFGSAFGLSCAELLDIDFQSTSGPSYEITDTDTGVNGVYCLAGFAQGGFSINGKTFAMRTERQPAEFFPIMYLWFFGGRDLEVGRETYLMFLLAAPVAEDAVRLFRRGDVDGDGRRSLTDAVGLLSYLHDLGPEPGCLDAADADDDGGIGLADALLVLNHLFLNAAPPPPPAISCFVDPTEDELDCRGQAACLDPGIPEEALPP